MSTLHPPEQRRLLRDASPTPIPKSHAPLLTVARHRPRYTRVASVSFNDPLQTRDITDTLADDEITPAPARGQGGAQGNPHHGLGIISANRAEIDTSGNLPAMPSQEPTSNVRKTPEQSHAPYSPPSTGGMTESTKFDESFDMSYHPKHKDSRASLQSAAPSTYAKSDAGLLSVRSAYTDFEPHERCASKRSYKHVRLTTWVSVTILTLAVFATVFSGIFLIIALRGPRYGRLIRNGGSLTPGSAAFLTSFFAKLIELSFVTVVVAFIGQALARRAFTLEHARGITLAELNMRTWILQPGTMLTQWESVRYAGLSFLGIVSFLGALSTMSVSFVLHVHGWQQQANLLSLYTSAATALVQPQLVLPKFESHTLQGLVKTSFANSYYIADSCQTPITESFDKEYAGTTCLQIEHSSNAYHNYYSYLSTWTEAAKIDGNSTNNLATRPRGYALFADNTTIQAPWIDHRAVTQEEFPGYIINNVTMAMPHIGVVQAAIDPINKIMQPYEVDGATYSIRASVPSPMVNALCVTLSRAQLAPLVYSEWNLTDGKCNQTDWVTNGTWPFCAEYPEGTDLYLNNTQGTGLDPNLNEIFRWGSRWGANRYPPIFPKLPIDYNTLINETNGMITTWGPTSIYLLGKGGPTNQQGSIMTGEEGATNYALCSISAGQTPLCTTHYNASSSGGSMEAICDTDDPLQYNQSVPRAPRGNDTLSPDWINVAQEWARSMSFSFPYLITKKQQASNNNKKLTLILFSSNFPQQASPSAPVSSTATPPTPAS